MGRIDDVGAQTRHDVCTRRGGRGCPGCSRCERNSTGKSGKGTAVRLAAKLNDPDDQKGPIDA